MAVLVRSYLGVRMARSGGLRDWGYGVAKPGQPRLVLMCGLPGAGKTTLARRLEAELPAVRLCPDEWMTDLGIDLFDEQTRDRLETVFWRLARDLLRLGQSVVLESGFWLRADRDEKRLGARTLGAAVELRYLDVPLDELCRRVESRTAAGTRGIVVITGEMLEQYATLFQAPTAEEIDLFDEPVDRASRS
jgi:predicted kinase